MTEKGSEYGNLERAAIDFTIKYRAKAADGDFGSMEHLAQAASVIQAVSLARAASALERIAGAMEAGRIFPQPAAGGLSGPQQEQTISADSSVIARSWDRTPSAIEAPPAGGDVG